MDSVRALPLIAGLVLAGAMPSRAQDYPARPVTIVVPTGPGGGMEMVARLVAPKLEQRFGKPFVIENRPGRGPTSVRLRWRARHPTATPS